MRRILAVLAVVIGVSAHPAVAGASAPSRAAKASCHPIDVPLSQQTPLSLQVPLGTNDPIAIASTCPGVRPGARLMTSSRQNDVVNGAQYCTMNFLFTDGGSTYVGTAGHCLLGFVGEYPGDDPGVDTLVYAFDENIDAYPIGRFVFAIRNDVQDFALIRLDGGVGWDPQVCFFGGPRALNDSTSDGVTLLHHFGQGVGLGELTPGRTAVTPTLSDPNRVLAAGIALFGDSGSPVLDATGAAIGVMVSIEANSTINRVGVLGITRLGPEMTEAGRVLGRHFSLIAAPLL